MEWNLQILNIGMVLQSTWVWLASSRPLLVSRRRPFTRGGRGGAARVAARNIYKSWEIERSGDEASL